MLNTKSNDISIGRSSSFNKKESSVHSRASDNSVGLETFSNFKPKKDSEEGSLEVRKKETDKKAIRDLIMEAEESSVNSEESFKLNSLKKIDNLTLDSQQEVRIIYSHRFTPL